MGKIKINETASEPDMKKGSNTNEESDERIMPIEHYVTVSAKVENPEAGVSIEGAKSTPRKKPASTKKTGISVSAKSTTAAKKSGTAKKSASTKSAKKTVAVSIDTVDEPAGGATKALGASGRKKTLALPAGSIGAVVLDEKEKAANTSSALIVAGAAGASSVAGAAGASGAASAAGVAGTAGAKKTGARATGTKRAAKLAMDGMVKPAARTVEVTEVEPEEDELEERNSESEKSRFSKPKAALIGVGVALVVALIGGLVIGLFGRKDVPLCVVQFESNGGSKIMSEEVVCGETVERPEDPTKEGFAFQDWMYGGEPFDFGQMTIDKDMTLMAKWQVEEGVETVTVHFDTNGGSEMEDVEVKKGGVISEPVEPTRVSFEFAGWKLNGEDFDFSQPIEEDMTLVAEWTPVAGGNEGATGGGTTTPEKPAENPNVESLAVADVSMRVGDTKMIDVTMKPGNARYQMSAVSGNEGVATCSIESGPRLKCIGKAAGETVVTLRDRLTGNSAQFKVTVVAVTDVTFIELTRKTLNLDLYGKVSETLRAAVTATGDVGAVIWTTSNDKVAKVDQDGNVTAVGVGKAWITATVGGLSDSCEVTVTNSTPTTPVSPPEGPGDEGDEGEGGEDGE